MSIDWEKFDYSSIGDNILERFFNEGHGIKEVGDYNDLLKLPKVFEDETKIENLEKYGVEETKETKVDDIKK